VAFVLSSYMFLWIIEKSTTSLSDCSADDFEVLFETQPPTRPAPAKPFGAKPFGHVARSISERARGPTARTASAAVEKRSLLMDVDVLVS